MHALQLVPAHSHLPPDSLPAAKLFPAPNQVSLSSDRVIPLAAFRGTTRPIILAGSRGQLNRALAGAEPFREALRERGVSIVPIQLSAEDADEKLRKLKAEFGSGSGDAAAAGGSKGFGGSGGEAKPAAAPKAAAGLSSKDRKWQLKAANEEEWVQWLQQQKAAAGISADAVYVQVRRRCRCLMGPGYVRVSASQCLLAACAALLWQVCVCSRFAAWSMLVVHCLGAVVGCWNRAACLPAGLHSAAPPPRVSLPGC